MNELEPLSPEATDFLTAHRETGAPTTDELARLRARVVARRDNVAPLRRGWRMPEVWAVAAVVLVAVVGQLLYLVVRGERGEARLNDAWVGGSVEQVDAAISRCTDEACRARGAKMLAAMTLASRESELTGAELTQLEALDAELSSGGPSPLAARVAQQRARAAMTPEQRLEQALVLRKRGELAAAQRVLEECVTRAPEAHACWRTLGDVSAQIAASENSAVAAARAREAYEAFLVIAPADDPSVPRITAMMNREATPAHEIDGQNVKLVKGAKATLKLKAGLQRVAVGDPEVLDIAAPGGDTLQLMANGVGATTVLVWFADGTRQTISVVVE